MVLNKVTSEQYFYGMKRYGGLICVPQKDMLES